MREEKTAFINGQWISGGGRGVKQHHSPIDSNLVVGTSVMCTKQDVDDAVRGARKAQAGWAALSGVQRGNVLYKAAQTIEEGLEELAQLLTLEMGKPIGESRGEVGRAVGLLRYYAGEGMRNVGEVIPASDGVSHLYSTRVPLGVVGVITPWNFPVAIPIWKIAPALIYGNAVVWKAAEFATITAARLMEILDEAGLPKGVIQLVSGSGSVIGQAINEHPLVAGVTFTGSDTVGKSVARAASERGAKYQLEMGGKNASIVLDDADLNRAADTIISAAMRSAGQKCTATSRVIVQQSVKAQFTELLAERARSIKLSDPREKDCYLGPVVSRGQRDSIIEAMNEGVKSGAKVLAGGQSAAGDVYDKGFYIQPTVFDQVGRDSALWQEEIFGPVVAVMAAEDLDQAIEIANDSRFGLAAAIFTQNQASIHKFIGQIEAGLVKVNGETAGVELQAPFGGMKQSSSYSREQGKAAIEFFTQIKTVVITP